MPSRCRPARHALWLILLVAGAVAGFPQAAQPQTVSLTTVYSFTNGADGGGPAAPVLQASDGNFYGTTSYGADGDGTAFRLTPTGTLVTLVTFNGANGGVPSSGLIEDTFGSLYGTASAGYGTVFEIYASGAFATQLAFKNSNGSTPEGGLIIGKDGNFYGTTYQGGSSFEGTVFQLSSTGVLTTLVNFTAAQGGYPSAPLIQGTDGNFYGTTSGGGFNGGTYGTGTVFQITSTGVLTTLAKFNGGDPRAGLVQGSDGNFYGTTYLGGANGSGTVFRVTPAGVLTTLWNFTDGSDGGHPAGALIQGSDGNFYGTTSLGGGSNYGTIFRLTPAGALSTLATFNGTNGAVPQAGLIFGSDGSFYGTTSQGGSHNYGTVFRLTMTGHPLFFSGEAALGAGVYYLAFPNGNIFGYYNYQFYPTLYHYDLGFEYVIDAQDGAGGLFLYDFASGHFWYTSPVFPFPYLYDFGVAAFLECLPDPNNPGHYTKNPRYFANLTTGQIITQ